MNRPALGLTQRDFLKLKAQAKELIDLGNSREKAEGYGIEYALGKLKKYGRNRVIKKAAHKRAEKGNDHGAVEVD